MPAEGPGKRYSTVATKATSHGAPVVENRHPGIAAKSSQVEPMAATAANALLAADIAIGEELVIMLDGLHEVAVADLPAGAAEGDPLYITVADNALADAAEALTGGLVEAEYVKFGLLSSIDTALGRAQVNLNLRDTF